MTRIEYDGIRDLVADLEGFADDIDELSEDVRQHASDTMIRNWRRTIRERGFIDTADMVDSVRRLMSRKVHRDGSAVEVSPYGRDRKGVRNAEKAFVLHFGAPRRGIPASGYVDRIQTDSADEIDRYARRRHEEILARRHL